MRTLFLNPAYPPRTRPWSCWCTPRRMVPQNLANGFSAGDDWSRARLTVEVPPMSASQPVANWLRSSCELRVNSVMGFRLGSLTPSMRATCRA